MNSEVVKGSETRTEESSKRAGDELESDSSKKQKIDEHVEVEKNDIKGGHNEKAYEKLIKMEGWEYLNLTHRLMDTQKGYSSKMIKMLQGFDREDLGYHSGIVPAAKLPVLNPREFKLWKMRIEQYFLMTGYALWEVIVNGDSPPPKRTVDGVEQTYAPTIAEEKLARKNKLKAIGNIMDDINIDDLTIERYFKLTQENHAPSVADIGASVNIMSTSVFEELSLAEPRNTNMIVEMADKTKCIPQGIIENILVKIDKTTNYKINLSVEPITQSVKPIGGIPNNKMKHYWKSTNDDDRVDLEWEGLSCTNWVRARGTKTRAIIGAMVNKLPEEWFSGVSKDKNDLEGIINYLEPTLYDGFSDLDDEAYKQRRNKLLGMPYTEPLPILKEEAEITRYNLGDREDPAARRHLSRPAHNHVGIKSLLEDGDNLKISAKFQISKQRLKEFLTQPTQTNQTGQQYPNNVQSQQFQQFQTASISANNAKFPYLEKDKYEIWAMKMEYWIQNADHNLWRIVQQGNSPKRLGKDAKGNTIVHPPVSLDEHVAVQRENKLRLVWWNEESKKMRRHAQTVFTEFSVSEEEAYTGI
ncbi:ribonuclease H-like domain-containing protein [Tanacetum coccineum]|uniref:Ribonuclease H-like domain-containing protein n=1 Tax=Tanacetum coccineum TaxID=301880 RepID=A0ABQ5E931_9ASTR